MTSNLQSRSLLRNKKFEQLLSPPIVICIAIFTGFILYLNTLNAPFVFDDMPNILNNRYIRLNNFSPNSIINIFKSPCPARLVANFSFALNYCCGSYNVKGYHLVNITIHILTAILLFLVLRTTLFLQTARESKLYPKNIAPETIAFLTMLLWMVNPLHTESVTYIVQRMNSMAAMFFLLAFWCYINARNIRHDKNFQSLRNTNWIKPAAWFSGAAVSGMLAMACKENAITLPAFILLYEWFFFQDLRPLREIRVWRWALIGAAIIIIAAAIYLGKAPVAMIQKTYAGKKFTMAEHVMTEWRVMVYYIGLILFPAAGRLNLDYDYPVSRSLSHPPTTIMALIAILSLLGLAVYAAKKDRLISFAIIWFFGNLLLESSFLGLALIFEHRTYLPSMMVCLIIILSTIRLVGNRRIAMVVIAFAVALNALGTYQRNLLWADKEKLWADCVSKSPHLARPHHNLGLALKEKGDIQTAISEYYKALAYDPYYGPTNKNLGLYFQQKEENHKALDFYKTALISQSDDSGILNNMGVIFEKQGDIQSAIEYFRKALQNDKDDNSALTNISNALIRENRPAESIKYARKLLKLDPDNSSVITLIGNCYQKMGLFKKAEAFYLNAIRKHPGRTDLNLKLASLYMDMKNINAAINQYRQALTCDPGDTAANINLGEIYLQQGSIKKATRHFKTVIKNHPENLEANLNLGVVYTRQNMTDDAIRQYQQVIELDPDIAEAYNNLGVLMIKKNNLTMAEVYFRKAIAINPKYTNARNNLTRLKAMTKRTTGDLIKKANK